MKEIPLTKGAVAIVDDDMFEELSRHRWYLTTGGYAARDVIRDGKKVTIRMHRQVANTPDDMDTDHINNDRLDNRKSNLRVCTRTQNLQNTGMRSNSRTGYKGAAYHRFSGLYHSTISVNKKQKSLGYFKTPEEAARAYNDAAVKYFGEYAKLNEFE